MTVHDLRHTMPQDEYLHWSVYHARRAQKQQLAQQMAKNRRPSRGR